MRTVSGFVLAVVVLFPALASAQATIAGTVRDTSGAILPGVTVEASSPALIEKVRTAVTDGSGQYQVVNLRPGIYTVTFASDVGACVAVAAPGAWHGGGWTNDTVGSVAVPSVGNSVTVTFNENGGHLTDTDFMLILAC